MERPAPSSQTVVYAVIRRTMAQSHMRKAPATKKVRCIGLDVYSETIALAVAEPGREDEVFGRHSELAGGGAKR
jgi:hypothetical protein